MQSPTFSVPSPTTTADRGHLQNIKYLIRTNDSFFAVIEGASLDVTPHLKSLQLEHEPPCRMGTQHRDIGFYSDNSSGYKYAGQTSDARPFSEAPIIRDLMLWVNSLLGTQFNGALVNLYRDGTKYLGPHRDNEKELDNGPFKVVGVAFGATRTFRIRSAATNEIVLDYPHTSGTLIIMGGNFNTHYKHEIPQQRQITEPRLSITFRRHIG
jgi:alkylated DNA repair dioxygenase AlkB